MSTYTLKQKSLTVEGSVVTGAWDQTRYATESGYGRLVLTNVASVSQGFDLAFQGTNSGCKFHTHLFVIDAPVAPNWFAVAVPDGHTEIWKPNIFFHPTPRQGNHLDENYPSKFNWEGLFWYAIHLGAQLAAAGPSQIIIAPFMTQAATEGMGILPNEWEDIVMQILTQLQPLYLPDVAPPTHLTKMVVSSFSSGIVYSHQFRKKGRNVSAYLKEVYDFDGMHSTYRHLSQALVSTPDYKAIRYDQEGGTTLNEIRREAASDRYHVPKERWTKHIPRPLTKKEVHYWIPRRMAHDCLSWSGVGRNP